MQQMDVVQLAAYLETSKPQLIDVREPWEFEICHLENSINIPMGQIPQHLSTFSAAPESVVICHHGVRSMHVIQYLQQQGISNLINLDGGVDAWAQQVDKDMPLY
jgi:rhodanese-related sulfurtransferase